MAVKLLTPSAEQRMKAYHELSHRAKTLVKGAPQKPTITLSREFGCEAFPVGEELVKLLERMTDEVWILVDKSLLDEVAKEKNISEDIIRSLGQKPRWLDDMFATLSPKWKSDRDYYQFLVEQVVSIATAGNAVFVGLGAAIITQHMKNCHHFRLIADQNFKVQSMARRMNLSKQDAELLVVEQQKERNRVIRKLLDADERDPRYYHLIFNNGKVKNQKIVQSIADYVVK
ncbi:AAA family ATPase [Geobacter sp.]|uniref:cytidylate kinase-like family protein n=1 Tax=Geobacter sp. TaxID=46610 RepID=UPI0027BA01CE|nr:cytidylate kinase-like family protein [Geobacter sp.]